MVQSGAATPRAATSTGTRSIWRKAAVIGAVAVLMTSCASAASIVTEPTPDPGISISVSGNQLIDQNGNPIQLVGVNFSGAQYACAEGWGFFDAPATHRSIHALKSWGINAVRLPLNESCWLGINGVPRKYGGRHYRQAVAHWVRKLNKHGFYVIVDEHHTHNGDGLAVDQQVMPNQDHAVDYWTSVASRFADNPGVLFDLFNEPYPDDNSNSRAAWRCVRDGGDCAGVPFVAAGMQELLDAVRATGAKNPVLVAGPQYAGELGRRWLRFAPDDPDNQLVASVHIYGPPLGSPYDDPSRWHPGITRVARQVPVIIGELGETDCGHDFIDRLMPWADRHGISYFAWGWVTSSCADEPALISDYDGTPTPYGIGFRAHVRDLGLRH